MKYRLSTAAFSAANWLGHSKTECLKFIHSQILNFAQTFIRLPPRIVRFLSTFSGYYDVLLFGVQRIVDWPKKMYPNSIKSHQIDYNQQKWQT